MVLSCPALFHRTCAVIWLPHTSRVSTSQLALPRKGRTWIRLSACNRPLHYGRLMMVSSAVGKFRQGCFDFIVSVTPLDPHEFHWAVVPGDGDYWRMYFGPQYMRERPLLPTVCRPNGSIKIARLHVLAQLGHFFGHRMGVTETPLNRSVHVAEEFDLKLCEMLLAERDKCGD